MWDAKITLINDYKRQSPPNIRQFPPERTQKLGLMLPNGLNCLLLLLIKRENANKKTNCSTLIESVEMSMRINLYVLGLIICFDK